MTERTLISNERALHEAFERFCRETCSPGANTSEFYWRLFKAGARATDGTPQPSKNQALAELIEAAEVALTEMCHTNAPRNSFTDAVDRLDAAITFAKASAGDTKANAHETLQPHQNLALARINHLARKGRFDEADAQLFRDAIVHRPGSVPHHHIWSVNGPPRDPDPEQVCDFGCGLKWKDRQEAEAHAQKANSCVCGEPNSPGTHRTDGPCLAPIGDRR